MLDWFQPMADMATPFVQRGEALGIIEYWFNRYQTAISAIVALIAALWAAKISLRGVHEAINQQRKDRLRIESEAKECSRVVLASTIHAAAVVLLNIRNAQNAVSRGDKPNLEGISAIRNQLGQSLQHFSVQEIASSLEVNQRIFYLMILRTLNTYVLIYSDRHEMAAKDLNRNLKNQEDLLVSLLRYLRPFDSELAEVFERDSTPRD